MTAAVALTPEARDLLAGPHLAHVASVREDGSPSVHPVWIGLDDDDRVLVCTGRTSPKTRNILRDPHVAFSVVRTTDPYEELMARGVVAEVRDDSDLHDMDALSLLYTGAMFPVRGGDRVTIVIDLTWVDHRILPFARTPGTP